MRPRLGTCFIDSWSWMLDPEFLNIILVMVLVLSCGNKLANGVGLVKEDGLALTSVQLLLLLLLLQFSHRLNILYYVYLIYIKVYLIYGSALALYQQERGKGKAKREYNIAIDNRTSDKEEVMYESNPGSITYLSLLDITSIQRFDPF